jgi:hypothetical protein
LETTDRLPDHVVQSPTRGRKTFHGYQRLMTQHWQKRKNILFPAFYISEKIASLDILYAQNHI